jgi:Protein of unknown function (DUF1194)
MITDGERSVIHAIIFSIIFLLILFLVNKAYSATDDQINVDVALVLAVDASSSMDDSERKLQREGYAKSITSANVLASIREGFYHRIAITMFEWGSKDAQHIIVPWTIIDSEETAQKVAQLMIEVPAEDLQRTSISGGLLYAQSLLRLAPAKSQKEVIDVSGDGPNNDGEVVDIIRDRLVNEGIVINGLPIVTKDYNDYLSIPDLDKYYEHCVIGGWGSFTIPVKGMVNFQKALEIKLITEISENYKIIKVQNRDWNSNQSCHLYE